MFPISDLARAGDIRMRRRRALALLAGIALVGILAFGGLNKAERLPDLALPFAGLSYTDTPPSSATGAALLVDAPCAGSITVMPKPGLSGRVLVSMDGEGADNGIRLTSGPTISLSSECRSGAPDLALQAPASMPLTIVQTGGTDLRLGAFTGAVTLIQHGGGDMVVDGAGPLKVAMTGGGDLSLGHLHGNLNLVQIGGGDVRIADIEAAEAGLSMTGSGDFAIVSGKLGRLHASLRGTGDLMVGAVVGDAIVQAGKSSDVSLPHVTGRLTRNGVTATQP